MDKISTIKQNILYFIESQSFNKEDFFNKIGVSYSNFKGKSLLSEIGADKIVKILTIFPQINPDWLLTNKGEMLRTGENLPNNVGLQIEIEQLKEENSELKSKLIACYEKMGFNGGDFKSKAS